MRHLNSLLKLTGVTALTVFSTGSLSHSEHAKPRYVAPFGIDSGSCEQPQSPCQSIGYAAGKSNKGDLVLVAAGDYQMTAADDVFYLLSDVVKVKAGYNPSDNYQQQDISLNRTTLTGVPVEFADKLRQLGFVVLSDLKSLNAEARVELDDKLASYKILSQRQSNQSCENGQAGGFSCDKVDLLAHMPLSDFNIGSGNDIWGYVDLNTGREYAIMGFTRGFAVVDVTEPTAPSLIGTIPGQRTTWRDIKVHQYFDSEANRWKAYAYVTADRASVGLTIVDLNDLANGISVANIDKTDISAHNVFVSNVDYSTGVALTGMEPIVHLAGANNATGAFNSYTINTSNASVSKTYVPTGASGYSHDVSAMVVTDERAGTQCQAVNGACEIFFDYNEKEVRIWDKSNNAHPKNLSTFTYPSPGYVHSGWTSEDGRYVFVHDELDEMNGGESTVLRVFDINDLGSPKAVGSWFGPSSAIDHNGFVRGNRYYMSNYERGLQILDITDPAHPQSIGHFDTYGVSDKAQFNGAWGVYPFLPSGNIIVSDINSGLYIFADKTVGTAEFDSVKFDAKQYQVVENGEVVVSVERVGDPSKAVSVQYETHAGSAGVEDFAMTSGTLNWSAGDSQPKLITLKAKDDVVDDEPLEMFFVRLFNPQGGLSLAAPNISTVMLEGKVSPPSASFAADAFDAKEIDGTISIPVVRRGDNTVELNVNYDIAGGSAVVGSDYELAAGVLNWAAGDTATKYIDVALTNDSESETVEQIQLMLSQNTPGNAIELINISVRDDESNQAPTLSLSDDQSVNAQAVVNLAAIANDPEGFALSYQWTQTSGAAVSIEDDTASSISFRTPAAADTLVFELSVTDDFGAVTSGSVTITVKAPVTPTEPVDPTQTVSSSGGGSMFWLPLFGLLALFRRRV